MLWVLWEDLGIGRLIPIQGNTEVHRSDPEEQQQGPTGSESRRVGFRLDGG